MVDSARARAIDVLLDQRLFVLDGKGTNSSFARSTHHAARSQTAACCGEHPCGEVIGCLRGRMTLTSPVPLTTHHSTAQFDCGEAVLNEWLAQGALRCAVLFRGGAERREEGRLTQRRKDRRRCPVYGFGSVVPDSSRVSEPHRSVRLDKAAGAAIAPTAFPFCGVA